MISDNLEVGVVQPVGSSKEKNDIERWIVLDVENIWRWAWRSPSQVPKKRKA